MRAFILKALNGTLFNTSCRLILVQDVAHSFWTEAETQMRIADRHIFLKRTRCCPAFCVQNRRKNNQMFIQKGAQMWDYQMCNVQDFTLYKKQITDKRLTGWPSQYSKSKYARNGILLSKKSPEMWWNVNICLQIWAGVWRSGIFRGPSVKCDGIKCCALLPSAQVTWIWHAPESGIDFSLVFRLPLSSATQRRGWSLLYMWLSCLRRFSIPVSPSAPTLIQVRVILMSGWNEGVHAFAAELPLVSVFHFNKLVFDAMPCTLFWCWIFIVTCSKIIAITSSSSSSLSSSSSSLSASEPQPETISSGVSDSSSHRLVTRGLKVSAYSA